MVDILKDILYVLNKFELGRGLETEFSWPLNNVFLSVFQDVILT